MSKRALALSCFLILAGILLAGCGGALSEQGEPTAAPTSPVEIPIEDLLVYVPAGPFYMGSNPEQDPASQEDEQPLHHIVLDGYFIYRNEVSNALYKQCVAAGECTDPQIFEDGPSTHYNDEEYKDNPVVGVNWNQANAFCNWAEARLPTEAEWEKTARGEDGDTYPWGNDAPSCSLSNMAGCIVDPPDTDKIGQYPDGESYVEANDLSGNVWEWTLDWYDPEYYTVSPGANPLGPEQGELRVVRGGSYEDGPEALRSAERLPLDPELAYNNVGFRCVPIGVGNEDVVTPPFCQPSYVPFCRDPFGDPNEDCDPLQTGENTPSPSGEFDLAGFGCPENGLVTIRVDAGDVNPDDYTTTVGGVVFNCVESTVNPGQWVCTGSPPPQGTITTITVCPGGQTGNAAGLVAYQPTELAPAGDTLVGYQPEQNAQLVAYAPQQEEKPALEAYQPTPSPAELQGYEPSAPAAALVAYAAVNNTCPTGYLYNPTTGQCEQDPNGACPEGWTFNTATNQCEPGDSGCPEGTSPTAAADGCTPTTGEECPDGFTYSTATNTCEPPGNDDGGGACPAGYFFDASINCCSPIPGDNLGCEPGSYRNVATNECEPYDENGCPDGTVYNRYEGGCVPDNGDGDDQTTDTGCRLEGYVMNEAGQCVPDGSTQRIVSACPEGTYYDENLGQCIQLPDDGCGPGYRRSAASNTCVPNDGPGSGCAAGYYFNERVNCCTPTPGGGESFCPGDPSADGQTTSLVAYPSQTSFDYGNGYCDPGPNGCPVGYVYDEQTGSCVLAPTGRVLETGEDGCPEGTYYDEAVGFCVQTSCGCQLGFHLDAQTQTCVPDGDTTEEGCWSYEVSVPVCEYEDPDHPECDKDEHYSPATGQCEPEPTDCSQIGSESACTASGCDWECTGPSSYYCQYLPNNPATTYACD